MPLALKFDLISSSLQANIALLTAGGNRPHVKKSHLNMLLFYFFLICVSTETSVEQINQGQEKADGSVNHSKEYACVEIGIWSE